MVKNGFATALEKRFGKGSEATKRFPVAGRKHDIGHGDVVIAAITFLHQHVEPERDWWRPACWRRSGGEGSHAEAVGEDLARPRSQVVADYLDKSGLQNGARQDRSSTLVKALSALLHRNMLPSG
jgi:aconitate hydratase